MLGLGSYSSQQDRCEGGGLQFLTGEVPVFQVLKSISGKTYYILVVSDT